MNLLKISRYKYPFYIFSIGIFSLNSCYTVVKGNKEIENSLVPHPPSPCPVKIHSPLVARSPKLLIAEDNLLTRQLMEKELQLDYTLTFAENGQEALEQLEKNPFDLLITDINMPIMDGRALMRHIKEKKIDLPILVYSTEQQNLEDATKVFPYKPFTSKNRSQFFKMIDSLIKIPKK